MEQRACTSHAPQVVELLNQAGLETGKNEKLELLRQVQELIVNKEPALLDNFFEVLLHGADVSADRKFSLGSRWIPARMCGALLWALWSRPGAR